MNLSGTSLFSVLGSFLVAYQGGRKTHTCYPHSLFFKTYNPLKLLSPILLWLYKILTIISFLIYDWTLFACFGYEPHHNFAAPPVCRVPADISWIYTSLDKLLHS